MVDPDEALKQMDEVLEQMDGLHTSNKII